MSYNNDFQYVNNAYGVPACIGRLVIVSGKRGIIAEDRGHYIGVKQSQVIQPWMFGHTQQKATCLWLDGLEPLIETNNVKSEMMKLHKPDRQKMHYLPPSPDRWKIRSTTYQGIADALAGQYGSDNFAGEQEEFKLVTN